MDQNVGTRSFKHLRAVDLTITPLSTEKVFTVVTPNKEQSIFGELGSNKGISQIPLFVIFDKLCEIRDFLVEISQK